MWFILEMQSLTFRKTINLINHFNRIKKKHNIISTDAVKVHMTKSNTHL